VGRRVALSTACQVQLQRLSQGGAQLSSGGKTSSMHVHKCTTT
jgi:hypothetical protein